MSKPQQVRKPLPATFMVHDDDGKVWPPGFVSQLCDVNSPFSMLRTPSQQSALKANRVARQVATGWH